MTERLLEIAAIGGEWVLWGLIALSVLSVAVMVERSVWFSRRRMPKDLTPRLLTALEQEGVEGAISLLKREPAVECQITAQCLSWYDAGPNAMANVLRAQLREWRPELERGTLFLGTVGNNAPFIGLFGTVLGVVEAFVQLGVNAGGSNMAGVMSSIGEALIATAVGILVAIPAVVAFNVFARKAGQVEEHAEGLFNMVLAGMERRKARQD
jgi:biopolymer transport protein ExbB/biopolymer transport protein TolQ